MRFGSRWTPWGNDIPSWISASLWVVVDCESASVVHQALCSGNPSLCILFGIQVAWKGPTTQLACLSCTTSL